MFGIFSKFFDKSTNKQISIQSIAEQLTPYIEPQIKQLKSEGTHIFVSDIAFVYITMFATTLTGAALNLFQSKELVKHFFPEEEYEFSIENSFSTITQGSDFLEKCGAITPTINKEIREGEADYFLKYTRKTNQRRSQRRSSNFDIRNYDPSKAKNDWLDVS